MGDEPPPLSPYLQQVAGGESNELEQYVSEGGAVQQLGGRRGSFAARCTAMRFDSLFGVFWGPEAAVVLGS